MSLRLTFKVELVSDYHVSAGQGLGPVVDSALLRDHDGAPILRGTMITGLLRDGLADLKELAPTKLNDQGGEEATERLFGSPEQRKRWAYSTARPEPPECSPERWGAQDVARVRINPRTRRADPQKLFRQEEGDRRLAFFFTATCPTATARDQADAALLVAAARLVRHLGAARRRGRGECRLHLVEASGFPQPTPEGQSLLAHFLEEFRQHWLEGEPEPERPERPITVAPTLTGHRRRFRLLAYADEPLLFTNQVESGNAYASMDHIPGTALLGALASQAALRLALGDEASAPFLTLFLRGGVRVAGLFPAVYVNPELFATTPAPRSLLTCEAYPTYQSDSDAAEGHGVWNSLASPDRQQCPRCEADLTALEGFVSLQKNPQKVRPTPRAEMHIQMERESGRVASGLLYEYQALEAGQWFMGEMDCDEGCWDALKTLTDLAENQVVEVRLGKAAARGYGLVRLVAQPLVSGEPSPWGGQPITQRLPPETNEFQITLLTDTILHDPWGRFYSGFEEAWLEAELNLPPGSVQVGEQNVRTHLRDGFHTHRRLPRWRDIALLAGSGARVTVNKAGLDAIEERWKGAGKLGAGALAWHLEQVEQAGVGLRRNEGFGRLAFNHPLSLAQPLEGVLGVSVPSGLRRAVGIHPLQGEETFRREWAKRLDEAEQSQEWKKIGKEFAPIARLFALCSPFAKEQVRRWLEGVSSPASLWNKKVSGRPAKEALAKEAAGMKLLLELVEELDTRHLPQEEEYEAERRNRWRMGLLMLAERVSVQAEEGGKR